VKVIGIVPYNQVDLYNGVKTLPISVSSLHEKLATSFRPAAIPILK
jgi:hypothetical protein